MAYLRNKKDFDTGLLLTKVSATRQIKRTLPLFTLKLYKNKNIRCPFKVTANATDKSNIVFVARYRVNRGIFAMVLK